MKILSKKKLQKKAGMFFKRPPPRKEGAKKPEGPLDKVSYLYLLKIPFSSIVVLADLSRNCNFKED